MKKTVLITLFTLALISCNKKESKSEPLNSSREVAADTCLDLKEYRGLNDNVTRAKWLKEKGHLVCKDTLYKAILKEHAISSAEYDKYKNEFGVQTPLKMNWASIKDTIKEHFYDRYIGFNISGNKIVSMNLIPDYLEKGGSYSIPLFLSIADSLKLKDDDTTTEFEFVQTKESISPIIFKVVNASGLQMNYSTKPLKK